MSEREHLDAYVKGVISRSSGASAAIDARQELRRTKRVSIVATVISMLVGVGVMVALHASQSLAVAIAYGLGVPAVAQMSFNLITGFDDAMQRRRKRLTEKSEAKP